MQAILNTRVDIEIRKQLDEYAKSSGKSKASIVEEALRKYFAEISDTNQSPK